MAGKWRQNGAENDCFRCKAENTKTNSGVRTRKKEKRGTIKGRNQERLLFKLKPVQVWLWSRDFWFYFTLTSTSGL